MGTSKGYKPGSVLFEGCRSCSGEPKQPVPPLQASAIYPARRSPAGSLATYPPTRTSRPSAPRPDRNPCAEQHRCTWSCNPQSVRLPTLLPAPVVSYTTFSPLPGRSHPWRARRSAAAVVLCYGGTNLRPSGSFTSAVPCVARTFLPSRFARGRREQRQSPLACISLQYIVVRFSVRLPRNVCTCPVCYPIVLSFCSGFGWQTEGTNGGVRTGESVLFPVGRAVVTAALGHFAGKSFGPDFADAVDAAETVGTEDQTEDFTHRVVELPAITECLRSVTSVFGAFGATVNVALSAAVPQVAPLRLFSGRGASGTFMFQKRSARSAIEPACGDPLFVCFRHIG